MKKCGNQLKTLQKEEHDEYVPFVLEDYVHNPVALALINAGVSRIMISE